MQTHAKKKMYRLWSMLRSVRPVHLVVLLVIFSAVSVLALRHNNQTMVELRQAVYAADETNGDDEGALRDLREYVYAHMNTNLSTGDTSVYPPLQLTHTYDRLVEAEQSRLRDENGNIYSEAQEHCEELYPESFSGGPRVPCIREYVEANGVKANTIPDSLYKFNFVSPTWSPDVAGWSIVLTAVTALALLIRSLLPIILKALRVI